MKKLLIPATALLLAVVAAPAMAQDTLVSRGDVAKAPSFENLITAMTNTPGAIDSLLKRQTIAEGDIMVVDTKPLLEGKGDEMLTIQLDRNKDQIKQLQEVLGKHPAVEARLKKESASPSVNEVIAAEVLADGKVQLYYRKN
jgi:Flp pilus assembly protein TadD